MQSKLEIRIARNVVRSPATGDILIEGRRAATRHLHVCTLETAPPGANARLAPESLIMEKARSSSSTSQPHSGKAETTQTPDPAAPAETRARKLSKEAREARDKEPKEAAAPPVAKAEEPVVTVTDDPPPSLTEDGQPFKDVPVDWEALEDAFENNAPEVHSYLQLATGEVIRVVDGVADPQMHARIAADVGYLRVDPVSSREQYRWMERFIPMVDNLELRARLNQAIDGKGAFRRFKDVLMAHADERERWFTYRSERLKTFMDAWLTAHSLRAVARPAWVPVPGEVSKDATAVDAPLGIGVTREKRRSPEALRKHLRDTVETFGQRDLDTIVAFAEFLRARRAMRVSRPGEGEPQGEGDFEESPPSSRGEPISREEPKDKT
jgi:hypothetical protein